MKASPPRLEQFDDYWIAKDDEGYGSALVIKTSWSSHYLDIIAKYNIKIVRLNERLGWPDSDVSFLSSIPGIHGVDLMSENVTDVSPIFQLKALKTLSLHCKAKEATDFSNLENLQSVGLGWRHVYTSFFSLHALRSISIVGFPNKDLTIWKHNEYLKYLRLESKVLKNLTGIERFTNICQLHLHRCRKLESLKSLASATSIQKLRISKCTGLMDLSPVSNLSELKELELDDCGNIQSVIPIAKCKQLESLQIAGNTNVLNGNFNALQTLPKLKRVLLSHKKHYSHTADELEKKR